MPSQADWSLDYCVTCDKQTTEGLYCSQACRHADIDNTSRSHNAKSSTSPSTISPTTSSWSGFVLPPAYDFSASRFSKSKSACNSPVTDFDAAFDGIQTKRSSVSSFAESTTSKASLNGGVRVYTQPQPSISQESKEELQRYEGLFVKTRHQQQRQLRR